MVQHVGKGEIVSNVLNNPFRFFHARVPDKKATPQGTKCSFNDFIHRKCSFKASLKSWLAQNNQQIQTNIF